MTEQNFLRGCRKTASTVCWSHERQQTAVSVVFDYRLILAKHAGHMPFFSFSLSVCKIESQSDISRASARPSICLSRGRGWKWRDKTIYKVNKNEWCKFPLINYRPNMTLVCLGRVNTQPRTPVLINICPPQPNKWLLAPTLVLSLHVCICEEDFGHFVRGLLVEDCENRWLKFGCLFMDSSNNLF